MTGPDRVARVWDGPVQAAYVHVPFCRHHCGYCNFTVIAGRDDLIAAYLDALGRELTLLKTPRPVQTLFVGGGTPSHLTPPQLTRLLDTTRQWLPLEPAAEATMECNPADLDAAKVELLAAGGITRISLGAQSFAADTLRVLERDHTAADIERCVRLARDRGLAVSLDLIFAAPGQTLTDWQHELEAAVQLAPDHLSTYGLTYEKGTQFYNRRLRGELSEADEELQRDMYAAAIDTLTAAGYEHYEVSNFARPGFRCRHNEVYWAGRAYVAAGPGAARYVSGTREVNHRSTTTWLRRIQEGRSPVAESETLEPEDRARELAVLGLRRLSGVSRAEFAQQTGLELDSLLGVPLSRFVTQGMLIDEGTHVRLSREGLFVSDALWPEFLRQ